LNSVVEFTSSLCHNLTHNEWAKEFHLARETRVRTRRGRRQKKIKKRRGDAPKRIKEKT